MARLAARCSSCLSLAVFKELALFQCDIPIIVVTVVLGITLVVVVIGLVLVIVIITIALMGVAIIVVALAAALMSHGWYYDTRLLQKC